MRKLIGFFTGIVILALVALSVRVALRIYNYSGSSKIDTVLMQPASLWQNRIDAPVPLDQMPGEFIMNHLIQKFAMEYLQVLPSVEELSSRAGSKGALGLMASPSVISEWRRDVLPELEEMASTGKLRLVVVPMRGIRIMGDYYVVPFRTLVWNNSNDLNLEPVQSDGRELYLKLQFEKGIRDKLMGSEFNAGKFLDKGMPAPAIFKFVVEEAIIK